MHAAPWNCIEIIAKVISDFEQNIEDSHQYSLYCWLQQWPNTSCGFGGMAGNAVTPAYTVVLRKGNRGYVYHNGRIAGEVDFRRDLTMQCFKDHSFPGAIFKKAWEDMI